MKLILILVLAITSNSTAFTANVNVNLFQTRMLGEINAIRQQHIMTPALATLSELTVSAQSYADELAAVNLGVQRDVNKLIQCGSSLSQFQSGSSSVMCGESLALVSNFGTDNNNLYQSCNPDLIVQLWNSQRLFYNYSYPPNDIAAQEKVADYTQLIWKNTKYIGVGVAENREHRACFVVARYWPAGNILNQYRANVSKACSINILNLTQYLFILLTTVWIKFNF